MKQLLPVLMACALGAGSAAAQLKSVDGQGFGVAERALESANIRLFLRPDNSGSAVARECDTCKPMRLLVEPTMRVVQGGKDVAWDQSLRFGSETVDIFYDHESKIISRIVAP